MASDCCWTPVGWVQKSVSTSPPLPVTGHSNQRCYARHTKDCSKKISNEHYWSRAILELLGGNPYVSGMPWMKPGEERRIPAARLASKILCERHNHSLSPLDAHATRFFGTLQGIGRRFLRSGRVTDEFYLFDGVALELWMLKMLCGIVATERLNDRADNPDPRWVDTLLSGAGMGKQSGLYLRMDRGATYLDDHIRTIPAWDGGRVVGLDVELRGTTFQLSTTGAPDIDKRRVRHLLHKPQGISLVGRRGAVKSVMFYWGDGREHLFEEVQHLGGHRRLPKSPKYR